MNRRTFLAAAGTAALGIGSGCLSGSAADVHWTYHYDSYMEGGAFHVTITGSVTNKTHHAIDEVTMKCQLRRDDDSIVAERSQTLNHLNSGEKQRFYFRFSLPKNRKKEVDGAHLKPVVGGPTL
ncbi:FxLYD domain-containing protein [Halarchaeum sp. P4]|uniref:FxLYD domain-containing protein n=1 Tax=Halarchaeum sp. P4 TaxID=3421639 RepID=UPI003EB8C7ED